MTEIDFNMIIRKLFSVHSKSFNDDLVAVYYEKFGHLSNQQWQDVVNTLIDTIGTFPKVTDIRKVITDKNYWGNNNTMEGLYLFECKCGASFVQQAIRIGKDIQENVYYKCPNTLYEQCNKTYSAEFVKNNGTFLRKMMNL